MLYIHFGCKTNQYESNAIMQEFIKSGYKNVNFEDKADVYVVNTCTVTNISDRKSRQILRRAKTRNKDSVLVATGCYVQVAKPSLEKIQEIDIILGNDEKKDIVNCVEEFSKRRIEKVKDISKVSEYMEFGNTTYTEKTRAFVKIQDGCDNFCSYCIIPYARGRIRSRKLENIVKEVEAIAKFGIKEVVLTGIQIAVYGKDLKDDIELIDLLEEIEKIDGIERIRIGSLEPRLLNEKFINRLVKLKKICPHFHLSLQSGCSDTLKRMNRKYTSDDIIRVVKSLRKNFEEAILTADIIVGFPGETDIEFQETYKVLKEIKLYKIHVFPYSKREGTRAAGFENQVNPEIKEKRSKLLIELSNMIGEEYNKSYIGKEVEVLVEEKENEYFKGHTKNYMQVLINDSKEDLKNKLISALVVRQKDNALICNAKGDVAN